MGAVLDLHSPNEFATGRFHLSFVRDPEMSLAYATVPNAVQLLK
jgi:hypothetical protein